MDKRTEAFESYRDHAWLSRSFKKLTADELAYCRQVLTDKAGLSKDQFVPVVVRLFLDVAKKPRHWQEIEELLICANATLP